MRKVARKKASGEQWNHELSIDELAEYLGMKEYMRDRYEGNDYAGVVTGLAWTAVGGEILYIESSLSRNKGEKLTLTGNLGDVMKESAVIALQYVKPTPINWVSTTTYSTTGICISTYPKAPYPKTGRRPALQW